MPRANKTPREDFSMEPESFSPLEIRKIILQNHHEQIQDFILQGPLLKIPPDTITFNSFYSIRSMGLEYVLLHENHKNQPFM